jgi:hypothetical protein
MVAFDCNTETDLFDFTAEAELFPADRRGFGRGRVRYQRFARAGDAIRFAIEELPPELLAGTFLEVNEARFGSREIRRLYDSAQYPLVRRGAG